jgi:high-affinity Fe2+/Pb2+ permease
MIFPVLLTLPGGGAVAAPSWCGAVVCTLIYAVILWLLPDIRLPIKPFISLKK